MYALQRPQALVELLDMKYGINKLDHRSSVDQIDTNINAEQKKGDSFDVGGLLCCGFDLVYRVTAYHKIGRCKHSGL